MSFGRNGGNGVETLQDLTKTTEKTKEAEALLDHETIFWRTPDLDGAGGRGQTEEGLEEL